jgi:hypothetical protein
MDSFVVSLYDLAKFTWLEAKAAVILYFIGDIVNFLSWLLTYDVLPVYVDTWLLGCAGVVVVVVVG